MIGPMNCLLVFSVILRQWWSVWLLTRSGSEWACREEWLSTGSSPSQWLVLILMVQLECTNLTLSLILLTHPLTHSFTLSLSLTALTHLTYQSHCGSLLNEPPGNGVSIVWRRHHSYLKNRTIQSHDWCDTTHKCSVNHYTQVSSVCNSNSQLM